MAIPSCRSVLLPLFSVSLVHLVGGCASLGSLMSPYPETFSCKNNDHGQCIHPDKAYADAVADIPSKSDPAVTNARAAARGTTSGSTGRSRRTGRTDAFSNYKDSVYRELRSLIETPTTPMLQPARTVRTLILPYADRHRPDRLYMPRYVYSVLDKPAWVIGDTLVETPGHRATAPVLGQTSEREGSDGSITRSGPMGPSPVAQPAKQERP